MAKKQTNVRLPEITRQQLKAIADQQGMTEGEVVQMAIDRLYRELGEPQAES